MDFSQIFLLILLIVGLVGCFLARWRQGRDSSYRAAEEANARMLWEQRIAYEKSNVLVGAQLQINAVDGRPLQFMSGASGAFGKIEL